jgi:3-oxoacyl-[acyl-carrier-protein] synthase II
VLESEEHARARGATGYAELAGYGSSFDAHAVTSPDPEARGAVQAMRNALADARVAPAEVAYVAAHGTSTMLNDRVETLAAKIVFGDAAPRIPMSSVKSMIGHLIGAAGVFGALTAILAIRDGVLSPTINLHSPDPECDLDYVPNVAREAKIRTALVNSFGFGGQNAAILVREYVG